MRRCTGNMKDERYLGNRRHKEVHDLDKEKTDCQIDEIIVTKDDVAFNWLSEAYSQGYNNCAYCLGGSAR